jgi:hypothetical protein
MEKTGLLAVLAAADALPITEDVVSYGGGRESSMQYRRAVDILDSLGLLPEDVEIHRGATAKPWEEFVVGDLTFDGPLGCLAASEKRGTVEAPIEKLATVTVDVDGENAEIAGPVAEAIVDAVREARATASRETLALVVPNDGSNVVPIGRGRQETGGDAA